MDENKINAFVILLSELDPNDPNDNEAEFIEAFQATLTTDERYEAYVRLGVINDTFFEVHPKLRGQDKTAILHFLDTLAEAMSNELLHLEDTLTEVAMGVKTMQDVLGDTGNQGEDREENPAPKPPTFH